MKSCWIRISHQTSPSCQLPVLTVSLLLLSLPNWGSVLHLRLFAQFPLLDWEEQWEVEAEGTRLFMEQVAGEAFSRRLMLKVHHCSEKVRILLIYCQLQHLVISCRMCNYPDVHIFPYISMIITLQYGRVAEQHGPHTIIFLWKIYFWSPLTTWWRSSSTSLIENLLHFVWIRPKTQTKAPPELHIKAKALDFLFKKYPKDETDQETFRKVY